MNEKHVFQRGGRIYDQLCGKNIGMNYACNQDADAPIHQMRDVQRAAAKPEDCPSDLIAFKWAETLSTGEQSVLLGGSLRRLQDTINSAITTVRRETREAAFRDAISAINAVPMSRYWSDSGEEIARSFGAQAIRRLEATANTEEGGGNAGNTNDQR